MARKRSGRSGVEPAGSAPARTPEQDAERDAAQAEARRQFAEQARRAGTLVAVGGAAPRAQGHV